MPKTAPLPPLLDAHPFAVSDAAPNGVSRSRLRAHDLDRPFRGVRTKASQRLRLAERCEQYECRMREGEYFSHATAALLWGAPLPRRLTDDACLDVSVAAPLRAAKATGVRGHVVKAAPLGTSIRFGLPIADPVTAWLQLARQLSRVDLIAVGDYLVLQPVIRQDADDRPFTTIDELRRRTLRYHGPGKRRAMLALPSIRTGVESRRETQLRTLITDAGLPEPCINLDVTDGNGTVLGRADLIYPRWRVIVEYDGQQHRTDDEQYERDSTRIQNFYRAGWDLIRVRKHGLLTDSAATVALVREALVSAGWRG